jgi:hypothetical protein
MHALRHRATAFMSLTVNAEEPLENQRMELSLLKPGGNIDVEETPTSCHCFVAW